MAIVLKSVKTVLGNMVELLSCVAGKPEVLVIGVFHGDEPQGKLLIEKYIDLQASKELRLKYGELRKNSRIFFIPCLNPDGMSAGTRTNANGVDLNRNFPTANWGKNEGENAACDDRTSIYYGGPAPASEIETKFVIEIIEEYKPQLILTLHAPYRVVNYDGPAKEIAGKISKITGYPVEESIGYPTPGSFGTYCGVERNIPTITLELDEKTPTDDLVRLMFDIFDSL